MRVGIYAYGPTSIQLTGEAKLFTYSAETKQRTSRNVEPGSHPLPRGIYLVFPIGKGSISVGGGCDMIAVEDDKDDWPDPKGQLAGFDEAFASVDHKSLKDFFAIVKGLKAVSA